jgi:hypothetical protein
VTRKITGRITEIRRTTERLYGIVAGISIDYKINDQEIIGLKKWLNTNTGLHHMEPFEQITVMVNKILADGKITEEEKEELLEWCIAFRNDTTLSKYIWSAIGVLHGILQGIAIDGDITTEEVSELRDWLYDYDELKKYWPFYDAFEITNRILKDGKVDETEKKEMLDFCSDFSEIVLQDQTIHDLIYTENYMQTTSQLFKPIFSFCDRDCQIHFKDKSFCFTGPARTGARSILHKKVEALGGLPKNTVYNTLDYLVIGAQSSPCWIYSTYGRKIEETIDLNRKKKANITILHELDFIKEVEKRL